MKKIFLLFPTLLMSVFCWAQGIEFEHGTWAEVQAKAKSLNKPIFVDVFTTWCGPCKMMSREIFPLPEVGKVFNSQFVNFKIDAEKGEGIDFAKTYQVKAYPTYLFIKPDGSLIFRSLGSMDAPKFIGEAEKAIAELNDPKPLSAWDAEYPTRKGDRAFMEEYLAKRAKLNVSSPELLDEYLKLIPAEQRVSPKVAQMLETEMENLQAGSLAFDLLAANTEAFKSMMPKMGDNIGESLQWGIQASTRLAARAKSDEQLAKIVEAYDRIPNKAIIPMQREEIFMTYYDRTKNGAEYIRYATILANKYLMAKTDAQLAEECKNSLAKLEENIRSGKIDTTKMNSTQMAGMRKYYGSMQRDELANKLNEVAWKVFEDISDAKVLQDALRWSKRAVEVSGNNPMYVDTQANLLYKIGQKQEAIALEEKALNDLNGANGSDEFKETLRKMKAGEKTWKN